MIYDTVSNNLLKIINYGGLTEGDAWYRLAFVSVITYVFNSNKLKVLLNFCLPNLVML